MMPVFNLSLDDMSPHKNAGLNFESIGFCKDIISVFPDFKVDLFVPAAYCRLGEQPLFLSDNLEWVEKVKALPSNFRICLHGYYHRRLSKKHGNSNNDEWQFLDEKTAKMYFDHMIKEFKSVGLKHANVFRPPGWKISASSAKVLSDAGFVIAGNKDYEKKISPVVKTARWANYNWDLVGSNVPLGDIYAYGHTSNWTDNFFNEEQRDKLLKIFKNKKYDFVFIGE